MRIDWRQWKDAMKVFGEVGSPRTIDGYSIFLSDRHFVNLSIVPSSPSIVNVFSPKTAFRYLLIEKNLAPNDFSFVQTTMFTDVVFRQAINSFLKEYRRCIMYINDLDSIGIAQWIAFKHGVEESEQMIENVHYAGINDSWLEHCEQWSTDYSIQRITIPMEKEEIMLLRKLDNVLPLERLVGIRSFRLMMEGYKIEIEGTINPALYREGHIERLFNFLRDEFRAFEKASSSTATTI